MFYRNKNIFLIGCPDTFNSSCTFCTLVSFVLQILRSAREEHKED